MITCAEGADVDSLVAQLQDACDTVSDVNIVAPTLGGLNGGTVFAELGFGSQDEYEAAKSTDGWTTIQTLLGATDVVSNVEFVAYGDGNLSLKDGDCTCHRVLIFHVVDDVDPQNIEDIQARMPLMNNYIAGLINCKIAEVVESSGTNDWNFAFECDYDKPETFNSSYMMIPYHWCYVDRYFDPECPQFVADPNLCTPYMASTGAFLTNFTS